MSFYSVRSPVCAFRSSVRCPALRRNVMVVPVLVDGVRLPDPASLPEGLLRVPWDRISDPESLRHMLGKGGVDPEEVRAENRWHPLRSREDWWTIAMGSGYRGTIEQLSTAERATVREANLTFIRDHGIIRLETNALYAVATKKNDPAPIASALFSNSL
jgi:hypothetical protein